MGKILKEYYQLVEAKAGLLGKVRLAMKTGIPSNKSLFVADSPENISKFKEVLKEILGEDAPDLPST
jgi:hypothetical protein